MKLLLRIKVEQEHKAVFAQFDKTLLQSLTPPGMKVNLVQFDEPTRVGGVVHIKVTMFGIIKQEWFNRITELEEGEKESFFVDEGERLPKMLKTWRHKHLVREVDGQTEIVDDIHYSSGWLLLDWLLYPVMWGQFAFRKPKYRKFFKAKVIAAT